MMGFNIVGNVWECPLAGARKIEGKKIKGEKKMEKIRVVNKDELVDKGKEIYKKELKDKLEPEHKGEFVAIDVKSGDYFLGKDPIEADEKARKKHPDNVFYLARIGYRAAFVHR